jgi:hypothetical protein
LKDFIDILRYLPLCHAFEKLNVLGVGAELHDCFFPGGRLTRGSTEPWRFSLPSHMGGGDFDDGDAEDLFDRLFDLDLVGVLRATSKTYFLMSTSSMDCSVMMGRITIS